MAEFSFVSNTIDLSAGAARATFNFYANYVDAPEGELYNEPELNNFSIMPSIVEALTGETTYVVQVSGDGVTWYDYDQVEWINVPITDGVEQAFGSFPYRFVSIYVTPSAATGQVKFILTTD